jgi:5-hydroxyisourate hydrolase
MSSLSTHVLDTSTGRPAAGLHVRLEDAATGDLLAEGRTDDDGRVRPLGGDVPAGTYRIVFDTTGHLGPDAFYPEVAVVFRVAEGEHYHAPLLLSPYGYSTYRGS